MTPHLHPHQALQITAITARLALLEDEVSALRTQYGRHGVVDSQIIASSLTKARLAALGEVSQDVAHELRQPLSIIILAVEQLQTRADVKSAAWHTARLTRIAHAAERAASLVENLHHFAVREPDIGTNSPVSLASALSGVAFLLRPSLHHENIRLGINLSTCPDLTVLAMQSALEQVLINLLINARDAINENATDTRRSIDITAELTLEGRVTLHIQDSGTGIPQAILARMFLPYVTSKGPERGTGLGLPLCRRLMTAMGGTIEAANTKNGARFSLTLNQAL